MTSILIVAGESSGDKHGARLVREFRAGHPDVSFFGVGGPRLAEAGVEILFPMEELAVMGLVEVVSRLPRIRRLFHRLRGEAARRRPRAAVLIDSPDFNLRLAKRLKRLGIPVLYYISPTVWAWRRGRLKTIKKTVAKMLLIFPFEQEIYRRAGIPAVFVGHPLVETVGTRLARADFFKTYALDPGTKLITLLPGSREGEVRRHLPVLDRTIPLLRKAFAARFVLVRAEGLDAGLIEKLMPASFGDLLVLSRDGYEAIAASDLVLSACGTANLETALLGTPFVAFYRLSPLTFYAGKRFVKISRYSIVNILAGRSIVTELIQGRFTPQRLFAEAKRLWESRADKDRLKAEFQKLHGLLGENKASVNAARELEKLLGTD
jgi:lipid-A-disaccharide synthase